MYFDKPSVKLGRWSSRCYWHHWRWWLYLESLQCDSVGRFGDSNQRPQLSSLCFAVELCPRHWSYWHRCWSFRLSTRLQCEGHCSALRCLHRTACPSCIGSPPLHRCSLPCSSFSPRLLERHLYCCTCLRGMLWTGNFHIASVPRELCLHLRQVVK